MRLRLVPGDLLASKLSVVVYETLPRIQSKTASRRRLKRSQHHHHSLHHHHNRHQHRLHHSATRSRR